MSKKNLWNNAHDVDIFGYPVEVYVEDKDEHHTASGLYSILNDEWITIPQQQKIVIDKDDISLKAEGYISIIPQLEKMFEEGEYENLIDRIDKIKERIRDMRSSGLEKGGLYSVENLAFKVLRRSNYVEKLNDLKIKSYDALMSLNELLTENASYSKDIDFKKKILDLTKHMLDKGMNIKPLPKVKFVNGDSKNARDFLGKTAYYNPNTSTITLYTEGRHPKDIVRSFSHEMIHHIQNLEDRLGDVSTTNTMEDDHIDKLEQEANLKGTMTFRNWTDSLNEGKDIKLNEIGEGTSEPFRYQKQDSRSDSFKYLIDSYITRDGETVDSNIELQGVVFNEELYYQEEDFLAAAKMEEEDTLEGIEISFYNVKADNATTDMFSAVNDRVFMFRLMATIKQILLKEIPNHKVDVLVYSPTKESDSQNTEQTGRHRLYTAFIKKVFPNARMHVDGQDNIVYFFLNESLNESIVGDKIKCDECGWSWGIKDGGNDLFMCHKCGHDNEPINEDKDYFGLNKAIKEIIEEPKYKIFSDMDGVLTDFDEAFKKVSNGIPPREYEKKFGKDKFWELIDGGGVDYWVEMPYMSDGEQYWDYIKDYNTELLSSPSRSSTSRLGKRQWVKNNMPGVKLTLAQAYLKRNYAAPNHILIDDRKSNIEEWRANGGIGILHTSAADTISQLKKLGL